jgi:hypothetical protein
MPARSGAEACTKISLLTPSLLMKPKPLMGLYHFTVSISWTLASKGRPSDSDPKPSRGGLRGAAVLLSTLITSVTCGPRCLRVTGNLSVAPGSKALMYVCALEAGS